VKGIQKVPFMVRFLFLLALLKYHAEKQPIWRPSLAAK